MRTKNRIKASTAKKRIEKNDLKKIIEKKGGSHPVETDRRGKPRSPRNRKFA